VIAWALCLAASACPAQVDGQDGPAWQRREASSPLVERGVDKGRSRAAAEAGELSPWRVVAWTAVVAGLLAALFLGARRWMRKGGAAAPAEAIRVVARRRVTSSLEVVVIEVGGRYLVLGAGKDSMNTLAELDPVEPARPGSTWEETLKAVGGGRDVPYRPPSAVEAAFGVGGSSPS
jgi:flagellar biogenesis protein FliO